MGRADKQEGERHSGLRQWQGQRLRGRKDDNVRSDPGCLAWGARRGARAFEVRSQGPERPEQGVCTCSSSVSLLGDSEQGMPRKGWHPVGRTMEPSEVGAAPPPGALSWLEKGLEDKGLQPKA